ncbi:hypothetical protein [Limnofasciculus baicalensis]|uniref:Uncharacterized protein n=1 Tax=Limnofasciculus baicalensis BBK-W-15 TaxID=2699891 RepID=A0AAE3GS53_9CYAN|nr:hypothetical protein [Limnofasciculus baicalensis]MCP2729339.1 hypothetical protein [Limnofasciculus baicalensis BBK-W-15]
MVRKKTTSRKKLDLTNLDTLAATTPLTEETLESEKPQSTEKVEKSTEASIEVSTLPIEELPEISTAATPVAVEKEVSSEAPPIAVEKEVSSEAPPAATPVAVEKEVSSEAPPEATPVIVAKKPSRSIPPEATPVVVAKEASRSISAAPTEFIQLKKKPQVIDIQPRKTLVEISNQAGEVFKVGDPIKVKAPWGGIAIAEIANLYHDNDGNAWVQYNPRDSMPKWTWNRGCTRASLLEKAS